MAISLNSLSRGKRIRAPKLVVYGGPKVGKSTFASKAQDAVFIQTEEGLDALDVTRFPLATSYQDVMDALNVLATQEHNFRAVVLDSLDWTENLVWQNVCQIHDVKGIEQVGGGFGKGYLEAVKLWRDMLDRFDYLRNEREMVVILIAHDESRRMDPPDGEPYNYAALKLHKHAAAVIEEWTDCLGYAMEKRYTKKDDVGFNKKHVRAVGSKSRTLIVGKDPAYVTGNRYGMVDEIPLEWSAFIDAIAAATTGSTATEQTTPNQPVAEQAA